MDNNEENNFYRNLVILLDIFKNRPNHLAKYLKENGAFKKSFINKIIKSKKLNNLNPNDNNSLFTNKDFKNDNTPYFKSFSEMDNYYGEIIDNLDEESLNSDSLNNRLANYLNNENYEEAANLRDFMKGENIPIRIVKQSDGSFTYQNMS